jgi:phosphatidyl-myo-inositol alpha-mannosyltransferase
MKTSRRLSVAIVYDDTLDSQDGVAQHVKTLGSWLTRQGHNVSYLVGETKLHQWQGGKVFSLSKNRRVTFNGNLMTIPLPAKRSNIKAVLEAGRFDVIHVMMPYSPFMAARVINLTPSSTAVVGTFHIYPSGFLARAGARLLKLMLLPSQHRFVSVMSVSQAAAGFAKQSFGVDSVVVPNPVDITNYVKASGHTDQPSGRVVFLGRLVKRKGCGQLVEAFAILKKRLPSAELAIAGDGPMRGSLEAKVKKLGLTDSVQFLGFVDEADKSNILAGASVACFPSLYGESFGIVLIEAMAAGAGVVLGGDNPGYRSILSSQPSALVNPTDSAEFAGRLYDALTDKKLRSKLHSWQKSIAREYDIEKIGPQVEKVYDLAIARTAKNGHNISHE